MLIPQVDYPNSSNGRAVVPLPSQVDIPSRFFLDMSGAAGLLGGDDAVSAMTAVHVYGNRRWLGWYNTPGSFQLAKRLNTFGKSASCHKSFDDKPSKPLSKNVYMDPTTLMAPHGCKGPKFRAAHSGVVIEETDYLGALFMRECATWDLEGKVVVGRRTQPVKITIVDLGQGHASEMHLARNNVFTPLFASVPIVVSISACVLCAVREDWNASLLILLGIVASGASCLVLGSADFVFARPEPANGVLPGDGLLSSDNSIVLLRGTEGAVNAITHGRFSLRFSSEHHYNLVRSCSVLFFIQCIAQLFLIPQASLFGHAMFLTSLGVSALYNAWLSSSAKEKMHQRLLFEKVLEHPTLTRYTLGTRTTAVVFILLVLQPQDPTGLLNELLPDDTKVWRRWKATILEQLRDRSDQSFLFERRVGDLDGFTQQKQDLLRLLYDDAGAAYNAYRDYLQIDSL